MLPQKTVDPTNPGYCKRSTARDFIVVKISGLCFDTGKYLALHSTAPAYSATAECNLFMTHDLGHCKLNANDKEKHQHAVTLLQDERFVTWTQMLRWFTRQHTRKFMQRGAVKEGPLATPANLTQLSDKAWSVFGSLNSRSQTSIMLCQSVFGFLNSRSQKRSCFVRAFLASWTKHMS